MSKKRRVFDIDLPVDDTPPPAAAPSREAKVDARRGPMAAAVRETAESLNSRAEIEQKIREENDRLAHEHVRLKKAGLITDLVPLGKIRVSKLIRDRLSEGDDLTELKESIRAIGLSNPIQLEETDDGYFELVQGFRRLSAWREMKDETGDTEKWGHIPATIIAKGEALERLYRRMVDENLVRRDISFGEMAVLARDYAHDPETEAKDVDEAVSVLYESANKQKRSYVRAFAKLLDYLQGAVLYPQIIPRALGLELRKLIEEGLVLPETVIARIKAVPAPRSPEDELAVLQSFVSAAKPAAPKPAKEQKPRVAKTTFRLERSRGAAKVTASQGRLEVLLDCDFSAKDRHALEQALAEFLTKLEE